MRIAWLANCLRQLQIQPKFVLDYGCGIGTSTPLFFELIGVKSVLGIDISEKLLKVAKQAHKSENVQFMQVSQYQPSEQIDLAFCNGVFHHIPLKDRIAGVNFIYRTLRPGGLFAFWENNPWSPGARYVMNRVSFDYNAIPLTPPETRNLLRDGNFEILRMDFLFIFPRIFRWLRRIEPFISRLPLGAQYQVLCRKPFILSE